MAYQTAASDDLVEQHVDDAEAVIVRVPADLRRQRVWTSTGAPEHEALLNQFGFRVVALPVPAMEMALDGAAAKALQRSEAVEAILRRAEAMVEETETE